MPRRRDAMRRLYTTLALLFAILTLPIIVHAASAEPQTTLYIRWDKANSVLCYSPNLEFTALSCVYIPPDGVQVNLPTPGDSKT